MTLFAQLVATAFQLVHDRVRRPDPLPTDTLNRYVRENHQLRLVLADTQRDLAQVLSVKLTKPQLLDRVQLVLDRIDLVLTSLRAKAGPH